MRENGIRLGLTQSRSYLEQESLPPNVLVTPFPLVAERPHKSVTNIMDRDLNSRIVPMLPIMGSSVVYNPADRTIKYPTRWIMKPDACALENDRVTFLTALKKWLPQKQNLNADPLEKKIAGMIRDQAARVSLQYDTFRRLYRSKDFISKIVVEGNAARIHMIDALRTVAIVPVERYFDYGYRSTATPKGVVFDPIGLGTDQSAPHPVGRIPGNRGVFLKLSSPVLATGKQLLWSLLYTFAAFGLVTGNYDEATDLTRRGNQALTKRSGEQLLINFSMMYDWVVKNNLQVTSWSDFQRVFPLFYRHCAIPTLGHALLYVDKSNKVKVKPGMDRQLADWLYALYMFLRGVSSCQEAKFVGFRQEMVWQYSGNEIPDIQTVLSCFRVPHRFVADAQNVDAINGPTAWYQTIFAGDGMFYTPHDSEILSGAGSIRLRMFNSVMNAEDKKKANNWHVLSFRSPIVMLNVVQDITSQVMTNPDLSKLNVDYYILNLNCGMQTAVSADMWRTDLEDRETVLIFPIPRGLSSKITDHSLFSMVDGWMAGGLPMYGFDSYIPMGSESQYIIDVSLTTLPDDDQFPDETVVHEKREPIVGPVDLNVEYDMGVDVLDETLNAIDDYFQENRPWADEDEDDEETPKSKKSKK